MSELRQPYTSLGVVNQTLDETIIINENRQEAGCHMLTGGVGLADYHTSEIWFPQKIRSGPRNSKFLHLSLTHTK